MTADVRVAVVGAGRWAQVAHIPGWQRDPRAEVVALADTDTAALASAAAAFSIPVVSGDYRDLLADPDIDVVDVVTGNRPHFQISWDALSAGKHVLCEKPVHTDYRKTREAAALAASRGLRTKLGFTFRYAPAVMYAKELIDTGFVGEPYIFNGFEQNSQWIDPATPLRQFDPEDDPGQVAVSSIEGYGAPIIDIMHWWRGAPVRLGGRGDHPARRRVRHLPDDQDRAEGRGRVHRGRHPGQVLPARRELGRAVGVPVLLQPGQRLHHRDHRRQPAQPGGLRPGRARAGDHQRVRGVVPRPGLGRLPARRCRRGGHTMKVIHNAAR